MDPSGSRGGGGEALILDRWKAEPTGLANGANMDVRAREQSRPPAL